MTRPLPLIACLIAGAIAATGGALAQSGAFPAHATIDLAAIRAEAARAAGDAEALAASARARARDVASEASTSAEGAKANGTRYVATRPSAARRATAIMDDPVFDFDRMVADAGDMAKAGMGEAPRFIAFASLSMPAHALQQMMTDVTRAGGVVAFRGLTRGSAKVMTEAFGHVLEPGRRVDGVGIDPRLFRAFAVESVPTYVVAASDFDLCSGFDCTSTVPPYDRISGNVTAAYALRTIAEGGGPGARIAANHLARLESARP